MSFDDPFLAPRHMKLLHERAIADDVTRERGSYTEAAPPNLAGIGFKPAQRRKGLVIPLHSVRGTIEGHLLRPDEPRSETTKGGKIRIIKYEMPKGWRMILDVPPRCRAALGDPKTYLFITEGPLKADSAASKGLCCIALLGVWNWRGTNEQGGKTVLADFESIALNGRSVFIVFDSDVTQKRQVRGALLRLKSLLESRGATVNIILLPAQLQGGQPA
jgi:Domain of unknown function (DUF3854)